MDWKLFFSTFALIFLAELGDKTQLAVLATSAGNKSWLAVLLGAVFALAASTVIAVVVGLLLNKTLPEKWIQAAAAALFIIFGLVLARSAWQKFTVVERPAEVEAAPAVEKPMGVVGRFVAQAAAVVEEGVLETRRLLRDRATHDGTREMIDWLIGEETRHLDDLEHLRRYDEQAVHETPELTLGEPSPAERPERAEDLLATVIDQEKTIARFYRELARQTHIPGLKPVFSRLARDEDEHVGHLESLLT